MPILNLQSCYDLDYYAVISEGQMIEHIFKAKNAGYYQNLESLISQEFLFYSFIFKSSFRFSEKDVACGYCNKKNITKGQKYSVKKGTFYSKNYWAARVPRASFSRRPWLYYNHKTLQSSLNFVSGDHFAQFKQYWNFLFQL